MHNKDEKHSQQISFPIRKIDLRNLGKVMGIFLHLELFY